MTPALVTLALQLALIVVVGIAVYLLLTELSRD